MPVTSLHPPVEETIHGVVVRDPYRWLEDRSLPETEEWIVGQQQRCDEYFAACDDLDSLRTRVRAYLDVEVADQPARVAGQYFYRRRNRGEEQASLYVRDATRGDERRLVDPADFGPFASVGIHRISPDGSLLAYELKQGGGDRKAIHILDVESGRTLSDSLEAGYARGFAFTSDLRGFYYCHEQRGEVECHAIRLHLFGTTEPDEVCLELKRTPGSRLALSADDVQFGAIYFHQCDGEPVVDLWTAPRTEPKSWTCVFTNRRVPLTPILMDGRLFAISYDQAPNGKLVELDVTGHELRTVIAEQEMMARQVVMAGGRIFINYFDQMAHSVYCWTLAGESLGRMNLPLYGTVRLIPPHGSEGSSVFCTFESFTKPLTTFEYETGTDELNLWHQRNIPAAPTRCVLSRQMYRSRDTTGVPITLVAHEEFDHNGPRPVLMTSYGGFGVSMTPQFSVLVSIMMELGCTFALPHIRGGGELGKEWHEAGRARNRQVAFDDFLAAADWLCEQGVTTPDQLALFGGSNSGLLVGAAMVQRPDLFRAVLCIAPLLDMVRYELFDQAVKWRHEYGSVENRQDFEALHAYSPYHRVEDKVDYPSVLFVSGDEDDRCNPAHVRKMAALLQDRAAQRSPIVVDYSEARGHSPVLPLSVRVEALARRIAFLSAELGISRRSS